MLNNECARYESDAGLLGLRFCFREGSGRHTEKDKKLVVFDADTVVYPRTVVIHISNTHAAGAGGGPNRSKRAMLRKRPFLGGIRICMP